MTLGYGRKNETGTLLDAVQILREDVLPKITEEDLRSRMERIERDLFLSRILFVRTHEPLINDIAFKMLRIRSNPLVEMQVVAFPTPPLFFEDNEEKLELALKQGAEVVGMLPHHENTYEEGIRSIKIVMDLATRYDKLVDGHVDEIDDPESDFAHYMIDEAKKRKWGSKTALSHITSTHYQGASFFNLVNKLRETEVSIVVNPETNLYLQGRYANINIPRGMARVNYLLEHGVNVSLGSDNVSDVVYPLGTFDMITVMEICRTAEWNCPLKVVTENGFRTINVNPPVIKEGEKAQLVVLRHDGSSLHYMPLLVLNGRNYVINNIKPEISTVD